MKKLLIFAVILLSSVSCKKEPQISNMELMEGQWKYTSYTRVGYYNGHPNSSMSYPVFQEHLFTGGKITHNGQEIGNYNETTVIYYDLDTMFQITLAREDSLVIDQCPDGTYNGQKITGVAVKRKFYK